MLILSWNVAGLTTTVKRVEDSYQSLPAFFERHNATIVCLQEHKVARHNLTNRSDRRILCDAKYTSYWSCCTDANKKGFNGVVTYVSTTAECPVIAADAAPLGVPALDQQGRCLLTDHGEFVVFNVYAPCSSVRGYQLELKLKFLSALRQAMNKQRSLGKAVILVGDLNISLAEKDIYSQDRVVYIQDVLNDDKISSCPQQKWKQDIQQHWPRIQSILETKQAIATQTANSLTGATYNKFRVVVTVENNRQVSLGTNETSAEYALMPYDFSQCSYTDPETNETLIVYDENAIRVGVLIELFNKLVGGPAAWDPATQREIAEFAVAERSSPTRKWLQSVLQDDVMVDTFRHYYPDADGRYTCWNQNKNCRYSNQGFRIDYILIDKSLLPSLRPGDVSSLRCGGTTTVNNNPLSAEAALQAVTAEGQFQPAGFGGGGMQEPKQSALDTQFGAPHTGHVYTPPTFSDHIGVSALLMDIPKSTPPPTSAITSAATRKAQPHLQQKSIASFFTKGKVKKDPPAKVKKQPVVKATKPVKKTLLDHFQKRESSLW